MKKYTIIDLLIMVTVTLLVIVGFIGILFGGTLVSALSTVGTLLVLAIASKICQNRPVYV